MRITLQRYSYAEGNIMLLMLVLLCAISGAHSTHFRGGIIMTIDLNLEALNVR